MYSSKGFRCRAEAADFVENIAVYLDIMAEIISQTEDGSPLKVLLKTQFMSPEYKLTIQCRGRNLRRFVVEMTDPWPHTAVVGKLKKNKKAQVYVHGAVLFMSYLKQEGLLNNFIRNLKEASLVQQGIRRSNENMPLPN